MEVINSLVSELERSLSFISKSNHCLSSSQFADFTLDPVFSFLNQHDFSSLSLDKVPSLRTSFEAASSVFDSFRQKLQTVDELFSTILTISQASRDLITSEFAKLNTLGTSLDTAESVLLQKESEISNSQTISINVFSNPQKQGDFEEEFAHQLSKNTHIKKSQEKHVPKGNQPFCRVDGRAISLKDSDIEDIYLIKDVEKCLLEWCRGVTLELLYDSKVDGDKQSDFLPKIRGRKSLYFIIFDSNLNVFGVYVNTTIAAENVRIQDLSGYLFNLVRAGDVEARKYLRNKTAKCGVLFFNDKTEHSPRLFDFGKNDESGVFVLREGVQGGTVLNIANSYYSSQKHRLNVQSFVTRRILTFQVLF
ncbi:hypothetical protein EIN_462410 [Entamoeba invadens IP1]|uniref:TLDc domain-containing protein n=1 Tax=Entamoeba invadens IP1 TaxID=370355 RepID=A0A0A1U6F6_ENTIV|nr:hypothetical protein EIN_462410 [Entamoeba invadens IP1]ELP89885.1 hypothetical protein EIN_462410 [Entamoeba invadens IP1]|eukprot:XP_004256656.1 hypothetical protein EIN_462410 [Entamoeba invadens IP1]